MEFLGVKVKMHIENESNAWHVIISLNENLLYDDIICTI